MTSYYEKIKEALHFIKKNNHFLVVSHIHPDGDTLSSVLAMAHILEKLGKSYEIVNQDVIPERFNYLPKFHEIKTFHSLNEKFSFVITLDVADWDRAGNLGALLSEEAKILNIDHHPTNDQFGDINVILPTAAATAEVVFDMFKEIDISLNKDIATCIYTGLLTDTGGFRYSNTSPKVMKIASQLLEYDIAPGDIAEYALETISMGYIDVLRVALSHLKVIEGGFIAYTTLSYRELSELNAAHDDTEGIVNYTRNIENVEVGLFFKEVSSDEIKVSLRSKRNIDVGAIAKSYGGGGHARAAGFTYYGTIEEIKKDVIAMIKNYKDGSDIE